MTITERLKKVIDYKSVSNRAFALKIGITSQRFGKYLAGREPDFETLSKIIETFDDISAEWLLTGEGEMLREANVAPESALKKEVENLKQEVAGLNHQVGQLIETNLLLAKNRPATRNAAKQVAV